ncbi:MAG: DUF937 domain-containing protein [Calditrichaeota bacterium]|nr:DUF937 domain-containing protein [Calditrichota bacterium]MCB9365628.1 DUF937 domain-containing protein [Calditrichota bacterium]
MDLMDLMKGAGDLLGDQGKDVNLGGMAGSVLGMLKNEQGGIGGLVEQFAKNGLGDVAKSWVGSGNNMPVNGDQLMQVFGEQKLGAMAEQSGMNLQKFLPILVAALPMIIDKLTPDGEVNDKSNNLLEQGAGLLGMFMKR